MTYSPLQIEVIKAFGSKELSEGCLLNNFGEIIKLKKDYKIIQNNESEKDIFIFGKDDDELSLNHNTEILGHRPELFPDFARVADEKGLSYYINTDSDFIKVIIAIGEKYPYDEKIIQYNPTLPLIDQDEQLTLLPLLSLIK